MTVFFLPGIQRKMPHLAFLLKAKVVPGIRFDGVVQCVSVTEKETETETHAALQ